MFSPGCPKCTEHTEHSYRGWFWVGIPVYANICSLGLNRIRGICGNLSVGMEVIMKKITLGFLGLTT